MASIRRMPERTVAFFEIVTSASGEQARIPQLDWDQALASLATASVQERMVDKEMTLVGSVATVHEQDHLLLHRVKDATEWLSMMDWNSGEWRELEQNASRGFVDTSAISFLPFGNVVGIMAGSVSAPTQRGLETWLNELHLFPDVQLTARPCCRRRKSNVWERHMVRPASRSRSGITRWRRCAAGRAGWRISCAWLTRRTATSTSQ